MKKDDVQFHGTTPMGYDPQPAVNVKVYKSTDDIKLPLCLGGFREAGDTETVWIYTDPEFTHDWISEHISERQMVVEWEFAVEVAWEMLQDEAVETFGHGVKVYSEGRSGGWAWVDGLIDFENWNAVNLSKWAKFSNYARAVADDVPRQMVTSIYLNDFEPWLSERNAHRAEMLALHSTERGA